jgi:EAL domain-containing protein (putative c-di-GMP-specific phosphodiesterase class I)/CheY-like chemotaxis protein
LALSLGGCALAIWLVAVEQARARVRSAPAERATTETIDVASEPPKERDVLGERIEALLTLNKQLAERTNSGIPPSLRSSGRFAIATPAPGDPAPQGKVLLVDDEPEVVRGFARVLKSRGHQVATASHAAEALKMLSESRFDLVVSDIGMPDMDGLQLLREVRRHDLLVPVILVTGKPAVETAAEAVETGAFQYLIKPVRNENLCQVVEHGIRVSRMAHVKQEAAELFGQGAALGSDRMGLEVSFDRTLESLWVAFQPIVQVGSRSVYAYESLLRSSEPALPHPGAVLDAAERLGRLDQLGRVIRAKAAGHVAQAPDVPRLFVNLHVRDLLDPDLLDPEAALTKLAHRVVLEITERSSLEDVRDARKRVAALRELGFKIAVDDMGAGYAGLSSFALLEPDVVKLDMSLIRDIHESSTKQRVVRSMTELSRGLGIEVVAEGVETVNERDTLLELGCDILQGYLFAKPAKPFPVVNWGDLAQSPLGQTGSR